jgi:hypothetical protein
MNFTLKSYNGRPLISRDKVRQFALEAGFSDYDYANYCGHLERFVTLVEEIQYKRACDRLAEAAENAASSISIMLRNHVEKH